MTKKDYERNYAQFLINSAKIIADNLSQNSLEFKGAKIKQEPVNQTEKDEVVQYEIIEQKPLISNNLLLWLGIGFLILLVLRGNK